MNIRDLNHQRVCVLGYGREGKAMVRALETHTPDCKITIADRNADLDIKDHYQKQVGQDWLTHLETFDVLIVSPGIPPSELPETGTPMTNSTQIFLDSIDPKATVVGVTGSKGKSTTASLLHHMLRTAGKPSLLAGNIGDAAIATIDEITPETIVVLEMSSYQLMRVSRSPHIAVITSFFPEHLNYHGSLEAYKAAKQHITKFQTTNDLVFYYRNSEGATDIASASPGTKLPYDKHDAPIAVERTKLIGAHNVLNIAGAAAVARHLGIADSDIIKAASTFEPLDHRLQYVGTHDGIHWVDDAISTTPESTIAAIEALAPRVKTIIVGGQDRGSTFEKLADAMQKYDIRHAITMGESGPRIAASIDSPQITVHQANSMAEAVEIARQHPETNDQGIPICLLSPASPGYDMYQNFEEKGRDFVSRIQNA